MNGITFLFLSGSMGVPAVENRPSIWGESPPKFVTKPSRLYLKIGQSGKFSAKITGRPQPLVQWYKVSYTIKKDQKSECGCVDGAPDIWCNCALGNPSSSPGSAFFPDPAPLFPPNHFLFFYNVL